MAPIFLLKVKKIAKKINTKRSAAKVFSEYRQILLKFIRARVSRLEDAEDILQDVFYQFARVENLLNPVENTSAWLYRVARNKIIDYQKKKKDEYIFDELAEIICEAEVTPETETLRVLLLEEIEAAIAELPKEQREVFELTELLGFSVKEVAEKTQTAVNTVLSRKHYAVKYLRKRLQGL